MKKIKRKAGGSLGKLPAYVVGYAAPDPLPPGLLSAWFTQEYGGPFSIKLARDPESPSSFEAHHGPWAAQVDMNLPPAIANPWHERLGWGHRRAGQVLPLRLTGQDSRDLVLHVARLARGCTLLTGGTAHDVATDTYLNPSDWTERELRTFQVADHLRIDEVAGRDDGRVWFHTRGLSKFGLEDLETYRPIGLSERPAIEALTEIAEELIARGKAPKVGEDILVEALNRVVRVVRHRTDQSYGIRMNLREVEWD